MGNNKKEPCQCAGLKKEVDELKVLVAYVIGCQSAIEAILQEKGITSHSEIHMLAIASMNEQKKLMTAALCKLQKISDQG